MPPLIFHINARNDHPPLFHYVYLYYASCHFTYYYVLKFPKEFWDAVTVCRDVGFALKR